MAGYEPLMWQGVAQGIEKGVENYFKIKQARELLEAEAEKEKQRKKERDKELKLIEEKARDNALEQMFKEWSVTKLGQPDVPGQPATPAQPLISAAGLTLEERLSKNPPGVAGTQRPAVPEQPEIPGVPERPVTPEEQVMVETEYKRTGEIPSGFGKVRREKPIIEKKYVLFNEVTSELSDPLTGKKYDAKNPAPTPSILIKFDPTKATRLSHLSKTDPEFQRLVSTAKVAESKYKNTNEDIDLAGFKDAAEKVKEYVNRKYPDNPYETYEEIWYNPEFLGITMPWKESKVIPAGKQSETSRNEAIKWLKTNAPTEPLSEENINAVIRKKGF